MFYFHFAHDFLPHMHQLLRSCGKQMHRKCIRCIIGVRMDDFSKENKQLKTKERRWPFGSIIMSFHPQSTDATSVMEKFMKLPADA